MPGASTCLSWVTTTCSLCTLAEQIPQPRVVRATRAKHAKRQSGLLIVGEAPGAKENASGRGFHRDGDAGKKLRGLLSGNNLARGDYSLANICRCEPRDPKKNKNRPPRASEIKACLPYLASLIYELKPKVILAVGGTAIKVLCGKGGVNHQCENRNASETCHVDTCEPHPGIAEALKLVQYVVPMPHTSPQAWNMQGLKVVGEAQVKLAIDLLEKEQFPASRFDLSL